MDGRQDIARAHALVTNEVFSHTSMYIEQSIYTYDVSFSTMFIMWYAVNPLRTVFPI